jgi:membrane protein
LASTTAAKRIPGSRPEEPFPTERSRLRLERVRARRGLRRTRHGQHGKAALAAAWLGYVLACVNLLRPVRTFQVYAMRRGPLMAAGIAYNMFFSVAALLVVGFAVAGLVAAGNAGLQNLIIRSADSAVPGLIDTGDGGLATPAQLFSATRGFGIALAVSAAAMVFTSLRWIAGMRQGMRAVFGLSTVDANPVMVKVRDLGTLVVITVALVLTTAIGLLVNTLVDLVLQWAGFSAAVKPITQAAGAAAMLMLDSLVALVLFHRAAVGMPRMVLIQVVLIAAAGSTLLRTFSTLLLGSADNNPLLAPFAVILGLFVWFFLLGQVYLLASAWGAVGTADRAARRRQDQRSSRGRPFSRNPAGLQRVRRRRRSRPPTRRKRR